MLLKQVPDEHMPLLGKNYSPNHLTVKKKAVDSLREGQIFTSSFLKFLFLEGKTKVVVLLKSGVPAGKVVPALVTRTMK